MWVESSFLMVGGESSGINLLGDSFCDGGFEFAAIVTAQIKFVSGDAEGYWVTGFPLAGSVAAGCVGIILAGVQRAFELDYDGRTNEMGGLLLENFEFGLTPVFEVVARD
jgi:hypothetical protein